MSVTHRTLTRRHRWPTRRAALAAGALIPSLAHAWLEGADAVLARADKAWTPRPVTLDLQVRWRGGRRSQARWSLGAQPLAPGVDAEDAFGRGVLQTLYAAGPIALADTLPLDRARRRMDLVHRRPAQVIGRAHGDADDRPALWFDHPRQHLLQLATGTDTLRLLDWDWTAATPTPTRIEHSRGGAWIWVAAVGVAR